MAGARRPGRNFLFVPGPTNVPDRILRAMHVAMEDHRSSDFPKLTLPLYEDLKRIFKTRDGAGRHLSVERHRRLGIRADQYTLAGRQDACRPLRSIQPSLDRTRPPSRARGHRPGGRVGHGRQSRRASRRRFAPTSTHEIKGVMVVHNETATGVTSDVAAVRRAIDAARHPALLYVDGVSSIASIDFRMDEWGVDLAITGSQKGLMLPAGLGIVCASQKGACRDEGRQVPPVLFRLGRSDAGQRHRLLPLYAGAAAAPRSARGARHARARRGSTTSLPGTAVLPTARAPRSRPGASSSAPRSRNGIPTP